MSSAVPSDLASSPVPGATSHHAPEAPSAPRQAAATGRCDPNNATLSRKKVFTILALVSAVSLALALLPSRQWLGSAIEWVREWGPWALVVFVVVYALLSSVALPTSPMNVAAGLLFGLLWGFVSSLAAVTLAAIICFFIARYVARDWVLRRVSCHAKYAALLKGLRHDSWKMIFLTRLNPLLPSAVANYCFGITPVKFRKYLSATVLGNAPLCFLLAYLGAAGQLASGGVKRSAWTYVLYGIGLAATIALTVWVTRYTKRKLKEYAEAEAVQAPPGAA
jgi:uncharacterized membrane protein YdjX (TVP38/TMEM64 family)